jgi:hypothetical protein
MVGEYAPEAGIGHQCGARFRTQRGRAGLDLELHGILL